MSGPVDPTFESDVRKRIYEYVEERGAASPSEIRHDVRVESGPPASKPARSDSLSAERAPMPVAQVREHLVALETSGYLTKDEGTYRVALGETRAAHAIENGTITIRPARHEERSALAAVIKQVASEESYIVARTIAEAIDHEETLLRHNERQSRVFFVATYTPNGAGDDIEANAEGNEPGANADGAKPEASASGETGADDAEEIVGWVHVEGLRLAEVRHVAEVTTGVLSGYRREGIGARLLEHGLNWAEKAGYEKVYQTLPATNAGAVSFLESQKWEREATHDRHYRIDDEYIDEVLLATWL